MTCIHCNERVREYGLYCGPCYAEARNRMAVASRLKRRDLKHLPGGTVRKLGRCNDWYGDDLLGILPAVRQ